MTEPGRTEHLFSYGTMQLEAVQLAVFGRKLEGLPDSLLGFRTAWRKIRDPEVVRSSGKTFYPMLTPSPVPDDSVAGTVFAVSLKELSLADSYEVAGHSRVPVVLASGTRAWVFVHLGTSRSPGSG